MDVRKLTIIFILFFSICLNTQASHIHLEKEYQAKWCKEHHAQQEIVLNAHTRADALTDEYVIEFDFAKKFYEAIGQSLLYSILSGKKPAIVLIMENPCGDQKYLNELNKVAVKYGIKVWTMTPEDMP